MINDMLHKLTVEQVLDPRSYVMFSTGGTAGMHASSFAPQLGVSGWWCPALPRYTRPLGW